MAASNGQNSNSSSSFTASGKIKTLTNVFNEIKTEEDLNRLHPDIVAGISKCAVSISSTNAQIMVEVKQAKNAHLIAQAMEEFNDLKGIDLVPIYKTSLTQNQKMMYIPAQFEGSFPSEAIIVESATSFIAVDLFSSEEELSNTMLLPPDYVEWTQKFLEKTIGVTKAPTQGRKLLRLEGATAMIAAITNTFLANSTISPLPAGLAKAMSNSPPWMQNILYGVLDASQSTRNAKIAKAIYQKLKTECTTAPTFSISFVNTLTNQIEYKESKREGSVSKAEEVKDLQEAVKTTMQICSPKLQKEIKNTVAWTFLNEFGPLPSQMNNKEAVIGMAKRVEQQVHHKRTEVDNLITAADQRLASSYKINEDQRILKEDEETPMLTAALINGTQLSQTIEGLIPGLFPGRYLHKRDTIDVSASYAEYQPSHAVTEASSEDTARKLFNLVYVKGSGFKTIKNGGIPPPPKTKSEIVLMKKFTGEWKGQEGKLLQRWWDLYRKRDKSLDSQTAKYQPQGGTKRNNPSSSESGAKHQRNNHSEQQIHQLTERLAAQEQELNQFKAQAVNQIQLRKKAEEEAQELGASLKLVQKKNRSKKDRAKAQDKANERNQGANLAAIDTFEPQLDLSACLLLESDVMNNGKECISSGSVFCLECEEHIKVSDPCCIKRFSEEGFRYIHKGCDELQATVSESFFPRNMSEQNVKIAASALRDQFRVFKNLSGAHNNDDDDFVVAPMDKLSSGAPPPPDMADDVDENKSTKTGSFHNVQPSKDEENVKINFGSFDDESNINIKFGSFNNEASDESDNDIDFGDYECKHQQPRVIDNNANPTTSIQLSKQEHPTERSRWQPSNLWSHKVLLFHATTALVKENQLGNIVDLAIMLISMIGLACMFYFPLYMGKGGYVLTFGTCALTLAIGVTHLPFILYDSVVPSFKIISPTEIKLRRKQYAHKNQRFRKHNPKYPNTWRFYRNDDGATHALELSFASNRCDRGLVGVINFALSSRGNTEETDMSRMKRVRGPKDLGRPHITLFDRNLNQLGACLCDTGASCSMLISKDELDRLKAKNLVDYVYTFSQGEAESRKLSTFAKAKKQPFLAAIAAVTFFIILEDQNDPDSNQVQSMTLNCSVVHNGAKPDYLAGTYLLAAKAWLPMAIASASQTVCTTLARTSTLVSDPPHPSALRFMLTGTPQDRLWTHPDLIRRHAQRVQNVGPIEAANNVQVNRKRHAPSESESSSDDDSSSTDNSSPGESNTSTSDNASSEESDTSTSTPNSSSSSGSDNENDDDDTSSSDESDTDDDENEGDVNTSSSDDSVSEGDGPSSSDSSNKDKKGQGPSGATDKVRSGQNQHSKSKKVRFEKSNTSTDQEKQSSSPSAPTSEDDEIPESIMMAINTITEETLKEVQEGPSRKQVGVMTVASTTLLRAGSSMQLIFAVLNDTSQIHQDLHYYVENTSSNDVSIIIDAGITDGLSLKRTSKALKAINLTEEDIVIAQGQQIAAIYECDEELILSESDPLHETKMKLYEEYSALSSHLMKAITKCTQSKNRPSYAEVHSLLQQQDPEAFATERAALQEMSPTAITTALTTGSLTPQQVTAHILPCIDLFAGIGGFTKGTHNTVLPGGKMVKVFLAIENNMSRMRTFQRNNADVPVISYTLGADMSQARIMLRQYVHTDLWHFMYAHASPPCAHSTPVDIMVNTRLIHWTIGFLALLSPNVGWTIEHAPNACQDLATPGVFAQTIDINEFCPLGVQRKRIILSNRPLQLPSKCKPMSLGEKLGFSSKDKSALKQFNSFNNGKELDLPGFPLIATIPVRIGLDLKKAKQINKHQLQVLTNTEGFDIQDLLRDKWKQSLVDSTPPAFARILTNAANYGDCTVHGLATHDSSFFFTGVHPHQQQQEEEQEPVGDVQQFHHHLTNMVSAIHSFGKATNGLQEQAIEFLRDQTITKNSKNSNAVSSAETHDQGTSNHQETTATGDGEVQQPPHMWTDLTPQQQADAHKNSMQAMRDWSPDYSDVKEPSIEDIRRLTKEAGLHENPSLNDDRDDVIYWFANHLIVDHWPVVDGVFRQAGPTEMRIDHTAIINKPGYRVQNPTKLAAMQEIIEDLLNKDIIAAAHGPYSSPALLVPKKHKPGETNVHKKWRFVSDYRALNEVTISDTYKPPPIDMLLEATAGSSIYSFLDLEKGFWQLPIEKESQDATTFTIPGIGVYHFKRMVMGLKNSSAVFQRHVDRALVGLLFRTCVAFIDDICIYSKSIKEHKTHLYEIFQRLLKYGHSLRLDKCSFFQKEHEFLGYILAENGVKPSPRLVTGLTNMTYPTSVKELRAWIGMMNYQRRFIENFAEKIAPLHNAVRMGPDFSSLTPVERASFDSLTKELKDFCDKSRMLYFPDWSIPIEIETDASRHAIAGWAFQTVNGERRPIAYISRSVSEAEKKYCDILGIHESTGYETRQIETLAILYVLEELNYLLEGAEKVTVRTDHRNILWLRQYSKPTGRLLRWAIKLSQVTEGVNIEFIKGELNHAADAMSRLFAHALFIEEQESNTPDSPNRRRFTATVRSPTTLSEQDAITPTSKVKGKSEHGTVHAISYNVHDIASLTNTPELEEAPLPHELAALPTRESLLAAQQADAEAQSLHKQLVELHKSCQPQENSNTDTFNVDTTPVFSMPLADIINMIQKLSLTRTKRRKLTQLAQRYRLDSTLSMIYVRPKARSSPAFSQTADGDIAQTRLGGALTNEAVLIPTTDTSLELRVQCMRWCHSGLLGGSHHGPHSTLARCRARFHWINMQDDVRVFCAACDSCRKAKATISSRHGLLQSFERNLPNDDIALDILTFKSSRSRGRHGEQHILMMYDTFSHFMIARTLKTRNLEEICDNIIRHLFIPFGAPKRFLADNEFFKKNFEGMLTMLKSKANYSSPYHSMGNPAERPLRHLQALLRIWVNCERYFDDSTQTWTPCTPANESSKFSKFGKWTDYLPFVVAAYNASPIPGTDISPFEVVFGRPYRTTADNAVLADVTAPTSTGSLHDHWVEKQRILAEIFERVRRVHRERAALNGLHYSMDHIFLEFKPSDLVMVRTPTREGKLAMQFIGPCKIVKKLTDVTYIVRDLATSRDMRAHIQRLCRYHADSRYGPPFQLMDEQNDTADEAIPTQGNLYWPNSEDLKQNPFDLHSTIIIRSHYTHRILVGEVIRQYADTNEIEIHLYMHEPDPDPRVRYDLHMPLRQRKLAPEYNYSTKKGELRAVATFNPKPTWVPETMIFNLSQIDILARDVKLTKSLHIPQQVLEDIARQYDIIT